jgi:hypothetical protein
MMDDLKIIKYLDGEMSGEELRRFEEEIRMNPPLADEIRKFRQVQELARKLLAGHDDRSGGKKEEAPSGSPAENEFEVPGEGSLDPATRKDISDAVRDFKQDPAAAGDLSPEFRRNLEEAGKRYFAGRESTGPTPIVRKIWYRAAAVVVLAIALSIAIFKPFAKMSADEIYARYFRPVSKTTEIIEYARTDNDFLFATEVYEAGDYERAVVLFEMLADSSQLRAWSLLYAGSSYMAQNKPSDAVDLFLAIIEEVEEPIGGDVKAVSGARWQLALCYLRLGEPGKAMEQLALLRNDPEYRRDANRILRALE